MGLHEAIRKLYFDQSYGKAPTQYFFISRLIYLKGLKLILPLQYFIISGYVSFAAADVQHSATMS